MMLAFLYLGKANGINRHVEMEKVFKLLPEKISLIVLQQHVIALNNAVINDNHDIDFAITELNNFFQNFMGRHKIWSNNITRLLLLPPTYRFTQIHSDAA